MQFKCQHCGALVRMLDLETKKIGCPNGCKNPIKGMSLEEIMEQYREGMKTFDFDSSDHFFWP